MGSKAEFLDITVKWRISSWSLEALSEGCQAFSEMGRAETITSLTQEVSLPDVLKVMAIKITERADRPKTGQKIEKPS